jgi:ArsR family transcriptional regulator
MAPTAISNLSKAARYFHALSDETRLRIIEQLHEGEQCVCEMTDTFRTGQSRLSFHLKVLKDAGLINDRPEGRWMYYSLNDDAVEELQDLVNWLKTRSHRSPKKGCCL